MTIKTPCSVEAEGVTEEALEEGAINGTEGEGETVETTVFGSRNEATAAFRSVGNVATM